MAAPNEDREMILGFVADGYELLDELEPNLIELQKSCTHGGSTDIEKLNAVFRLFHSLKGAAGFFNLHNVTSVTHEAETLLNLLRESKIVLTPERTSLLCRACDFMRTLLGAIEETGSDEGFEDTAKKFVHELSCAAAETPPEAPPEAAVEITITADMVQSFIQEADELLESVEQSLLTIEKTPDPTELLQTAFRSIHSFKGNCGFMGFRDLEQLSHSIENVLDCLRKGSLAVREQTISLLMRSLDALKNAVAELSQSGSGTIQGCDLMVELLDSVVPKQEPLPPSSEKIGEILISRGSVAPEAVNKALSLQDKPLGEMLVEMGATTKEAVETALSEQEKQAGKKIVRRDIRVDLEKLDLLMDLVGEMVIAQMMVIHNPDLKGHELENFEKAAHHMQRISAELQDVALSIRMVPLSATFRKMIRLVHDLALKFSKKVKLELKGEETEVDKTVIEHISDPLVHIIRNAIDHGIETPEARNAAGKDETGAIVLEALHDGGEVVIRITDDGAGLRRDKILRKGIERGLVMGNGEGMSDEEVFKLIFEPGFSTAEVVTDVSGRGVGMDVVRRNLEKIKGRVDISSTPGAGTTFMLRIPLTLAIIEGMLVRTGTSKFIIPLLSIVESFRPAVQHITVLPDGTEMVKVRQNLLQIARLHKLYNILPDTEQLHEGILVIVENQHEQLCLFVDEVIGQMQTVIKALPNYIGDVQGLSGCSIMGDGEVCLILDVGSLIRKAKHKTAQSLQTIAAA